MMRGIEEKNPELTPFRKSSLDEILVANKCLRIGKCRAGGGTLI
jgi:hypothetical protein